MSHPSLLPNARYVTREPMRVAPVTLEGRIVRLVPLELSHVDALFDAARFPEIWTWTASSEPQTVDDMRAYVETALSEQREGRAIPFVTTLRETGEVIGSTRYANIVPIDRKLDIGWTWMRPDRQRSGANPEAKALMLQHAFDVWGAVRVEIRTDLYNEKSQRAIERLGATREGVLRQQTVVQSGRLRDSVVYSIIDREWRDPSHPAHRRALEVGVTPASHAPPGVDA